MHRYKSVSERKPLWISQNFLTCSKTINRMLDRTTLCPGDRVVEIGAGKGHITRQLLKRCGKVTAVEKDKHLGGMLYKKLGCPENLNLIIMDFLKYHLPGGRYKVFANIPFSITSAIIMKIVNSGNPPEEMWLVMEKGAAKRHLGIPYETRASRLCRRVFNMKIVYHLRKDDFHPKPSVDTVLVHFSRI